MKKNALIKIGQACFTVLTLTITIIIYPILILLALFARNRGKGYFVGIQEIAGNIHSTMQALHEAGHEDTTSFAIVGFYYENYNYDHFIKMPDAAMSKNLVSLVYTMIYIFVSSIFYMVKFLYTKDKFVFYWNRSFLPANLDFLLLKLAKKKVVVFHCGDDVRYRPIQNKLMQAEGVDCSLPLINYSMPILSFLKIMYYHKWPLLLRIPIYTVMNQETFMDRPLYQFRIPQITELEPKLKVENKVPVIVHAPSDREIKGTAVVLKAMDALRKNGYQFDFVLLEGVPNEEVVRMLKVADIVIDQPFTWIGRFAIEALAHSCVVLGGNNSAYEKGSIRLPVIEFKRDYIDLCKKLEFVLSGDNLERIRQESYKCFQDYYSSKSFIKHLNGVFSGVIEPDLSPHENYKRKLLDAADGFLERVLIKIFIKSEHAKKY